MRTLYVDPSEEITGAIARLQAAEGTDVALVAPKGAALTQSVVNLKLLARAAKAAGKRLVLVTSDVAARNLAAQVGIAAAAKEAGAAEALAGAMPADEGAKLIGGVRIHRYYEEEPAAADAAAAAPAPEPIMIPKAVLKAGPPLERVATEAAAAGTAAAAAPLVRSVVPEGGIARSAVTPRDVPAGLSRRVKFVAFVLVLLLLGGAGTAGAVLLPVTRIVLRVPSQPFAAAYVVDASAEGGVRAVRLRAEVGGELPFKATGSKDVGERAKGTATFYNYDTTAPQSVPGGTRFTAGGQPFVLDGPVTVPGYSQAIGQPRVPGSAKGAVTAADPGVAGNVADANAADVRGPGYALSAKVTASGGSSRTLAVVTADDVRAAKEGLRAKLLDKAVADLTAQQAGKDLLTTEAATSVQDEKLEAGIAPGTEADGGTAKGSLVLQRLGVERQAVVLAAGTRARAEAVAGSDRQVGEPEVTGVTLDPAGSVLHAAVKVSGTDVPKVDVGAAKAAALGRSFPEAEAALKRQVPTATVNLNHSPWWWPVRRLPGSGRYVSLEVRGA